MLSFVRGLVPEGFLRAQILKGLRWAGAVAGGAITGYLVHKGISLEDATAIAASVGALIVAAGSALTSLAFSLLDGKKVDQEVKQTQADTAKAVLAAANSGTTAVMRVQQAVQTGPAALKATVDALNAGTF